MKQPIMVSSPMTTELMARFKMSTNYHHKNGSLCSSRRTVVFPRILLKTTRQFLSISFLTMNYVHIFIWTLIWLNIFQEFTFIRTEYFLSNAVRIIITDIQFINNGMSQAKPFLFTRDDFIFSILMCKIAKQYL